jgi:excinuclease ABC subunit C
VRSRETVRSELGEVPGIGQIRQRELLRYFGTVEKIKQATEEELVRAPKMNSKSAQRVYDFYRNREE